MDAVVGLACGLMLAYMLNKLYPIGKYESVIDYIPRVFREICSGFGSK